MDNPLIGSGKTELFGTLNYYKGEGVWGVYFIRIMDSVYTVPNTI